MMAWLTGLGAGKTGSSGDMLSWMTAGCLSRSRLGDAQTCGSGPGRLDVAVCDGRGRVGRSAEGKSSDWE